MKAATIVLAVLAMLGLSALSQLGLALADDGFLPQAQHNFSGELGSKVLTNSGGALQLGAACTGGAAGDVCFGGGIRMPTTGKFCFDGPDGRECIYSNSDGIIRFDIGAVNSLTFTTAQAVIAQSTFHAQGGVVRLTGIDEDIAASPVCLDGEVIIDTGGATDEICYCLGDNTPRCATLGAVVD